MKKCLVYFFLRIRCSLKLIPTFVITGMLVFFVAIAVLQHVIKEDTTVEIGVHGDIDGIYVSLASALLKESGTLSIKEFDSNEEGMSALMNREIHGLITVPDGFMSKAMKGKNIPLTYTALKTPSDISQTLTHEIMNIISPVVYNSQNAVFGMRKYLRDTDNNDIANAETERMMAKYILTLLSRKNFFDTVTSGVSHGVDLKGYYTAAMWVISILICGTVALPKMIRHNSSFTALLSSRGIGVTYQIICEWVAYTLSVCVIATATGYALFHDISPTLKMIPAVFPLTAMQFLIFELSSSAVSGTVFHFFTVMLTAYISGLFYPSFLFPKTLQKIGELLPSGQSFTHVKQIISGNLEVEQIFFIFLTVFVMIALSAVRRYAVMRGNGI